MSIREVEIRLSLVQSLLQADAGLYAARPDRLADAAGTILAFVSGGSPIPDYPPYGALTASEIQDHDAAAGIKNQCVMDAMRSALHELSFVHGLIATDNPASGETFQIDTMEASGKLNAAIKLFAGSGIRPS